MTQFRNFLNKKRRNSVRIDDYKQALIFSRHVGLTKVEIGLCAVWLSVAAANEVKNRQSHIFESWSRTGQKKVALKVENAAELVKIEGECKNRNITVVKVLPNLIPEKADEFYALGIGPNTENLLNQVIGSLKLI